LSLGVWAHVAGGAVGGFASILGPRMLCVSSSCAGWGGGSATIGRRLRSAARAAMGRMMLRLSAPASEHSSMRWWAASPTTGGARSSTTGPTQVPVRCRHTRYFRHVGGRATRPGVCGDGCAVGGAPNSQTGFESQGHPRRPACCSASSLLAQLAERKAAA
jgi:hypothetical protein